MAQTPPKEFNIDDADSSLEMYLPEEIKWHIERGHNDLVAYAKDLRIRAKVGKDMQKRFEEITAEKNHWVMYNDRWVKCYVKWGVPSAILSVISAPEYDKLKQVFVSPQEEQKRILNNKKSNDTNKSNTKSPEQISAIGGEGRGEQKNKN